MEQNIQQSYQGSHPGQVQVLGVDLWNGNTAQVQSFKNQTGVTFPLLLLGGAATGGNLTTLYGTYDNYVVIDKQGVVRYHAANLYAHGNRYHVNEIRSVIDGLVSDPTGIGDDPPPSAGLALAVSPNPSRGPSAVHLTNSGGAPASLSVAVFDIRGRLVRRLLDGGTLAPGETRLQWDGRVAAGTPAAPGRYWIRAQVGSATLARGVVILP